MHRTKPDSFQNDPLRQRIPFKKLLGRKYCRSTTRLVASSKVLHNAIPTRNCDLILTLPAKTNDSTLMWLLARLRARTPQIHVHVRHWKNTGVYAFYMTADYDDLLKGAEELGIVKRLKPEFGGVMKDFMFDEQLCYQGVEEEAEFLVSQERQIIVYNMLLNLRALQGETLGKIKFLEGQSIVPLLESKKIISQVFPLHEKTALKDLMKTWVQSFMQRQPLDKVREYYGVKIAMYFAYLGHYTSALVVPTVLGVVFWFLQDNSQVLDDLCFVTFALFNVFWATLYIENWRRRSSELAYKWGTLDKKDELLQDPRPLYTGYLVTSPVTGRLEPFYPSWKRNLFRYCVSGPVIGLCLFVVFYVMLLIFQLQEWVNTLIEDDNYITVPAFFQFLPKILLAVSIGILDEIYKKIAYWLNDKENYRLEETYENHLIIKLVLFQFVNSFLSLFYIAFYLQDMNRLRDQLATLLIIRQVIGNIREALVPYILLKMKLMKVGYEITGHMSPHTLEKEIKDMATGFSNQAEDGQSSDNTDNDNKDSNEGSSVNDGQNSALILTQAEIESTMKKYHDTFDDYLEMFIQYGYVILFSSAFPLAALCALVNNVIEIRSDGFKLCFHHQRPFGKRVRSIGIWLDVLRVMGIIAVIVNSALIGVSGQLKRMKPDLDTISIIIIIVALEHIILVMKSCISYAIPNQPQWIVREMARWEFQRREAVKSLESHSGSPRDVKLQPSFPAASRSPSQVHMTENITELSTPFVPARHHMSSLSSLSSENLPQSHVTKSGIMSESSSNSSFLPSDVNIVSNPVTARDNRVEIMERKVQYDRELNQENHFGVPLTKRFKEVSEQKVVPVDVHRVADASQCVTSNKYADKTDTNFNTSAAKHAGSIENKSSTSSGMYDAKQLTMTDSKLHIRTNLGSSNLNARLETRQRILQSAKSRQIETENILRKRNENI